MQRGVAPTVSVAFDPKRTLMGLKSRSAAVSCQHRYRHGRGRQRFLLRFRTIALFGDFARLAKHMRFPSRIRESPHFPASTRPIVKHIFGTSRGDDGAELAAAEKALMR
jgi:hypothetical protein